MFFLRLSTGASAIAGAILCATGAFAAPPLAGSSYNWSGWYAGGNFGYGFSSNASTKIEPLDAGAVLRMPLVTPSLSDNRNGVLLGLQTGLNFQSSNFVYGFEADLDTTGIKGSASAPPIFLVAPVAVVTSTRTKLDWFGTIRGRIGTTIYDRSFVYATGGLAYGRVTFSPNIVTVNNGPCSLIANLCLSGSEQKWKAGWTLGGGVEHAFAARWTAKVEYLYYDLGDIAATMIPSNGLAGVTFGGSTTIRGNIVRVGLNYKLN